ncbi:MAG: class I SAM-dependent RNA methyltransferase [Candidatus Altimarinota bacterium]
MLKKGDIVQLRIASLAFEGPGVARIPNDERELVVFVDGGVAPGDLVEVQIVEVKKKKMARGFVLKFLEMAEGRVEPRCPHFGRKVGAGGEIVDPFNTKRNCGGCSWQFLSYEDQLKVKRQMVVDSLVRLGRMEAGMVEKLVTPVRGMSDPWHYRNKMEFSFLLVNAEGRAVLANSRGGIVPGFQPTNGNRRIFGLHMKNRHHDLTEIDNCFLFRPWVDQFLVRMRAFFENLKVEGSLESLTVRSGINTGEILICLNAENLAEDLEMEKNLVKELQDFFGGSEFLASWPEEKLVSVFLSNFINVKGSPKKMVEKKLWGEDFYREKMIMKVNAYHGIERGGEVHLTFKVRPQAFFQPNTIQAQNLYTMIADLAGWVNTKRVLDLYCGTGTIGLMLSQQADKVIGVELNASAIEIARQNAEDNSIRHIEFIEGDVAEVLREFDLSDDLVVVDPPRAGLNPNIVERINGSSVKKLIYVSCNPTTLARDLQLLIAGGFSVKTVQPVDQFGQTYHIETVSLVERI